MHKKTIVFVIELVQRELETKVFLALEAAKRGYRAYFADFSGARYLATRSKEPMVFFHKGCGIAAIKPRSKVNHRYVVMDEEFGPGIPRMYINQVRQRRKIRAETHSAIFFASKLHRDAFSEGCEVNEGLNLVVSGWPKFNLYQKHGEICINSKITMNDSDKYILFVSSFGQVLLEQYLKYTDGNHTTNQVKATRLSEKYSMLEKSLEMLRELQSNSKTKRKIIIRPHNSEPLEYWKRIIDQIPNATLDKTSDLQTQLLESLAVIHAGSTVAIQCGLLGRRPIMISPIGSVCDTLMYDISVNVASPAELGTALDNISNQSPEDVRIDTLKVLKELMAGFDSVSASEIIMNEVDKLDLEPIQPLSVSSVIQACRIVSWKVGRQILDDRNIRRYIGKPQTISVFEKLEGGLCCKKIEKYVVSSAAFAGVDSRLVSVKRLAQNIIELDGSPSI